MHGLQQEPMSDLIVKQSERYGMPLPQKIVDAPELSLGLDFFYTSFVHLLTCRNMSGIIPFTDIESYAVANQITGDQKDLLHFHVRKLDNAYSDYQNKKNKRDQKIKNKGK